MKTINIADFQISNNNQLILIAGPCVIENEAHSLMMAEKITEIVLNEFSVSWVRLQLGKPGAVTGSKDVGVIIERDSRP